MGIWTGLSWPRIEREEAAVCECGDELSVSAKCGEFLD